MLKDVIKPFDIAEAEAFASKHFALRVSDLKKIRSEDGCRFIPLQNGSRVYESRLNKGSYSSFTASITLDKNARGLVIPSLITMSEFGPINVGHNNELAGAMQNALIYNHLPIPELRMDARLHILGESSQVKEISLSREINILGDNTTGVLEITDKVANELMPDTEVGRSPKIILFSNRAQLIITDGTRVVDFTYEELREKIGIDVKLLDTKNNASLSVLISSGSGEEKAETSATLSFDKDPGPDPIVRMFNDRKQVMFNPQVDLTIQ